MNEREQLTLAVGLTAFELICASAGAFIAWRSGRNALVWFLIGLIPIIGMFAVLFFVELPFGAAGASTTSEAQAATSDRKVMSAQQRRIAFALICWLFLFEIAPDSIKMPKWIAVLVFFGGALVVFALFGNPPNSDTADT